MNKFFIFGVPVITAICGFLVGGVYRDQIRLLNNNFKIPGKAVSFANDDERVLFSMGYSAGNLYRGYELSDNELEMLATGVIFSAKGYESPIPHGQYMSDMNSFFEKKLPSEIQKNIDAGKDFLKKFARESGSIKTKTGVVYQIIKKGNKKRATMKDKVKASFHGTLIDGTVVHTSKDTSIPIRELNVGSTLRGWRETLMLVGEGGIIKAALPHTTTYGTRKASSKIPVGSTLVYEFEVKEILSKK